MDPRPWHASYPPGVPTTIDPDAHASLAALCLDSCRRHAARVAFVNRGAALTFAEVDSASRHFAAWLSAGGLERGDRIGIMLPNLLQSPIVLLGALRAGLVVVNVNPLYTAPELEHQLSDSGARAIVVLENFAATLARALPRTAVETVVLATVGDCLPAPKRWLTNFVVRHVKRLVPAYRIECRTIGLRSALVAGAGLDYADPELNGDDLAFLQYTGGTTGVAKGAMLTHRNLVANVLQSSAWVRPFFDGARDTAVTALPLYHIFALTVNLFAFLHLGARNLLITNPRDMAGFVRELARYRPAFLTGVNTLFNGLLHTKGFDQLDFSRLRVALGGGMAVQEDVARSWQQVTGVPISQGYGLTEASPVVSANRLDITSFNGSVGLPFPSTDVVILDESEQPVASGEVGELCVLGPQVMPGYWQRPEDSAETFTADGWLKTGDIARMDATGRLYIEDRKKDLIIVSGFNVYPSEVENVVTTHPGVLEAAAVGVPSAKSGEAVKLFVVRKDPGLDADTLIAYCRERMTGYKTPDIVEFVDELPKSNVGKVLRRELKADDADNPRR